MVRYGFQVSDLGAMDLPELSWWYRAMGQQIENERRDLERRNRGR